MHYALITMLQVCPFIKDCFFSFIGIRLKRKFYVITIEQLKEKQYMCVCLYHILGQVLCLWDHGIFCLSWHAKEVSWGRIIAVNYKIKLSPHFQKFWNQITLTRCCKVTILLTAEIQVDGSRHISQLVFRRYFIHPGICLEDVIEFQSDVIFTRSDFFHDNFCAMVVVERRIPPIPLDGRFRIGDQLALEDQLVTIILLPEGRLLRKSGSYLLV